MQRELVLASVVFVMAGCGSSSPDEGTADTEVGDGAVPIDSGVGVDSSTTDSGKGTDALDSSTVETTADGADADETAVACDPDFGAFALGGAPGTTLLLEIGGPGRTDGIVASILEGGAELELTDIETSSSGLVANAIAIGGGAIHSVTAATGPYTAVRLGDAPGITALARDGTSHFGAGGLSVSMITTSPFAVTSIGALTPPTGCTKIVDFVATNTTSIGGLFLVTLDCGTTSRIKEYSWSTSSSTLTEVSVLDITGPAGAVGMGLNVLTTADGKLYQTSSVGSGSITYVRDLKPCIGKPTRGMQQ